MPASPANCEAGSPTQTTRPEIAGPADSQGISRITCPSERVATPSILHPCWDTSTVTASFRTSPSSEFIISTRASRIGCRSDLRGVVKSESSGTSLKLAQIKRNFKPTAFLRRDPELLRSTGDGSEGKGA